mmetsp:Transcript_76280/g.215906  ORF Transcript_76280/g.215906 Transcript_76280/m.215906 type:complete len:315 (+) Transcript_76280:116-1060(+)
MEQRNQQHTQYNGRAARSGSANERQHGLPDAGDKHPGSAVDLPCDGRSLLDAAEGDLLSPADHAPGRLVFLHRVLVQLQHRSVLQPRRHDGLTAEGCTDADKVGHLLGLLAGLDLLRDLRAPAPQRDRGGRDASIGRVAHPCHELVVCPEERLGQRVLALEEGLEGGAEARGLLSQVRQVARPQQGITQHGAQPLADFMLSGSVQALCDTPGCRAKRLAQCCPVRLNRGHSTGNHLVQGSRGPALTHLRHGPLDALAGGHGLAHEHVHLLLDRIQLAGDRLGSPGLEGGHLESHHLSPERLVHALGRRLVRVNA